MRYFAGYFNEKLQSEALFLSKLKILRYVYKHTSSGFVLTIVCDDRGVQDGTLDLVDS